MLSNKRRTLRGLLLGAMLLVTAACSHTAHDQCDPNNANACPSGQSCGTCSTASGTCNVCGTNGQDCTCN